MDSMSANVTPPQMISPSRVAGTLRSLVGQLTQDQSHAVVIGEEGVPQAVLISFSGFQRLLEAAGAADAAMVADRLVSAPQAGEGLSNEALARLVAGAEYDATAGEACAGGTGGVEGGPDAGGGA
ncbi:hypothetical protein ACFC58_34610 [Kitasatospora purpeofusca]|uniref:hypothetical protein n=1 Tax=Kitasatospora purpeofusca TaxID=67352 RepID=UPI0035DF5CD9